MLKKRSKISGISLLLVVLAISIVSLGFAIAGNEENAVNYCLKEGQIIEFSKCNPAMDDRIGPLTNICAYETSSGVYCPANPTWDNCKKVCIPFESPKIEESHIILIEPYNKIGLPVASNATNLDFKFVVEYPFNQIMKNCSVYLDDKFIDLEKSPIKSGPTPNVISDIFVDNGVHKWYVECISKDNTMYKSDIVEFLVGYSEAPGENQDNQTGEEIVEQDESNYTIQLIEPVNNIKLTGAQNVIFKYSFKESIDINEITECNLILNEKITNTTTPSTIFINETNTTTNKTTTKMVFIPISTEMAYFVHEGTHRWKIECVEVKEVNKRIKVTNYTSATRTLVVNPVPAPVPSSGGGGGGGGGSRIIKTNSTNATNATQESNITHLNITPLATTPPSEENEESEETTETSAPVTGSVIGRAIQRYKFPIIAVLIVLVLFFMLSGRKGKLDNNLDKEDKNSEKEKK